MAEESKIKTPNDLTASFGKKESKRDDDVGFVDINESVVRMNQKIEEMQQQLREADAVAAEAMRLADYNKGDITETIGDIDAINDAIKNTRGATDATKITQDADGSLVIETDEGPNYDTHSGDSPYHKSLETVTGDGSLDPYDQMFAFKASSKFQSPRATDNEGYDKQLDWTWFCYAVAKTEAGAYIDPAAAHNTPAMPFNMTLGAGGNAAGRHITWYDANINIADGQFLITEGTTKRDFGFDAWADGWAGTAGIGNGFWETGGNEAVGGCYGTSIGRSSTSKAIDLTNCRLWVETAAPDPVVDTWSLDWEDRQTFDSNSKMSIDWQSRLLVSSSGTGFTVDWENRELDGGDWHVDSSSKFEVQNTSTGSAYGDQAFNVRGGMYAYEGIIGDNQYDTTAPAGLFRGVSGATHAGYIASFVWAGYAAAFTDGTTDVRLCNGTKAIDVVTGDYYHGGTQGVTGNGFSGGIKTDASASDAAIESKVQDLMVGWGLL